MLYKRQHLNLVCFSFLQKFFCYNHLLNQDNAIHFIIMIDKVLCHMYEKQIKNLFVDINKVLLVDDINKD